MAKRQVGPFGWGLGVGCGLITAVVVAPLLFWGGGALLMGVLANMRQ